MTASLYQSGWVFFGSGVSELLIRGCAASLPSYHACVRSARVVLASLGLHAKNVAWLATERVEPHVVVLSPFITHAGQEIAHPIRRPGRHGYCLGRYTYGCLMRPAWVEVDDDDHAVRPVVSPFDIRNQLVVVDWKEPEVCELLERRFLAPRTVDACDEVLDVPGVVPV